MPPTFVLPLALGLVPTADRAAVTTALVERIRGKDRTRFDTGIYGTRYIGDVLLDAGEVDLFLELFTQKEFPGFGYMAAKGAASPVGCICSNAGRRRFGSSGRTSA